MKKQKGVTLLETILVLSLIAIIMVGGLQLYSNARSKAQAKEFYSALVLISNHVKSLYANSNDYGDLNGAVVNNSLDLPKNISYTGGDWGHFTHAMGNIWVSASSNSMGGSDDIFTLYIDPFKGDTKDCYNVLSLGLAGANSLSYGFNMSNISMSLMSSICESRPVGYKEWYYYYK